MVCWELQQFSPAMSPRWDVIVQVRQGFQFLAIWFLRNCLRGLSKVGRLAP
jgi:RNase P protein component